MVAEIKALCEKNKTSIKALERELGLGNGTIRRWDDSSPALEKVQAVANYFGVTVSYLTGEEQKEKPALDNENGLSPAKKEAWELIQEMDDDTLRKFIAVAKAWIGE